MRRFVAVIVLSVLVAALCLAAEPKVSLKYMENAQVELVSPGGVRVLIDIHDAYIVSPPAGKNDILLTTHSHWDHYKAWYCSDFPGQQLEMAAGELSAGDVAINGILGWHLQGGPMKNFIYTIETGGLRIVHFGDLGQDALSPEQMAAVGRVDVAIMQLANSYSDMNIRNKKGFNLMAQVKPRLIVLTHIDEETVKHANEIWDGYQTSGTTISLSPGSLPAKTSFIIMGRRAAAYAGLVKLMDAPW